VDLVKRNLAQDEQAFREAFDRVHGGNSNLHFGVKRTYQAFSKYYPGHKIPYAVFVEMCATCPLCQEYKIRSMDGFRAICKVIQPLNFRESVGIDRLSISPASERGNTTLIVIVTMWSKLIFVVPTSEYTAISIARALLKFFSLYGKFNVLRSDKGSDIISDAVNQLLIWMGDVDKIVSVTDIHTSNGVEKSNHKILQHLGALTAHHRAKLIWDTEEYLSLVLFKLNNSYNSETNTTAFGATFGIYESNTKNHFNFVMKLGDKPNKYVEKVHEHMKLINQITIEYQEKLNQEKTLINPPDELVNRYVAGDLVMLRNRKLFKDYKLDPEFKGVFEVVQDQTSNQVEIRTVNTGKIIIVFVRDYNL
jgi:ribosomal protein L21E